MSRPPAILSSWFLPVLSGILTLALAVLCIWQWRQITDLARDGREAATNAERASREARDHRARADDLAGRNLAAEARVAELNVALADARASLAKLQDTVTKRNAMTAAALADARRRIETANERIGQANETARTQEAAINRLAAERDDLVRRLNERTRAYNDLIRKTGGGN